MELDEDMSSYFEQTGPREAPGQRGAFPQASAEPVQAI